MAKTMMCSITLQGMLLSDIDLKFSVLYLSPFLKIGVMYAVLESAGTIPIFWDASFRKESEGPVSLATSFSTLGLIPSGPLASEGSWFWRSLKTPGVVMLMS